MLGYTPIQTDHPHYDRADHTAAGNTSKYTVELANFFAPVRDFNNTGFATVQHAAHHRHGSVPHTGHGRSEGAPAPQRTFTLNPLSKPFTPPATGNIVDSGKAQIHQAAVPPTPTPQPRGQAIRSNNQAQWNDFLPKVFQTLDRFETNQ